MLEFIKIVGSILLMSMLYVVIYMLFDSIHDLKETGVKTFNRILFYLVGVILSIILIVFIFSIIYIIIAYTPATLTYMRCY